jgi:hypothetical protein
MLKKALCLILMGALGSALFPGCSKPDKHAIDYSQVRLGVSNKVDVMSVYGKPKFILPNRDGTEQWSYDIDASGELVHKAHTLVFTFDKNGVLLNKEKFTSKWP